MRNIDEQGAINILLPPSLKRDPFIAALSNAFEKQLKEAYEEARLLAPLYDPVTVPEEVLNFIAFEKIIEYFFVLSIDEKRELIANAKKLKKIKGTEGALESILKIMNFVGKVEQWYEYSGEPGYFKLQIDVPNIGLSEENLALFDKLIEKYKRKSSWLEVLKIFMVSKSSMQFGMAQISGESITVYPWTSTTIESTAIYYNATGQRTIESISIYPEEA